MGGFLLIGGLVLIYLASTGRLSKLMQALKDEPTTTKPR